MSKRLLVHSAFEPYDVLIDRTTKYGNRYWEFGASDESTVEDKVEAHARQLMSDLESGKLTLWDIYDLKDKVLGCHCCTPRNPDAPCHGRNLITAIPFVLTMLRDNGLITEDGRRIVKEFKDSYSFLSNFYVFETSIQYAGFYWTSTEVPYQYSKFDLWRMMYHEGRTSTPPPYEVLEEFENNFVSPSKSKKLSRNNKMPDEVRQAFDNIKDDVMLVLISSKYSSNEYLKTRLLNTKDYELVEGNWWGDDYWGYSFKTNSGLNKLGKLTMKIRDRLGAV